MKYNYSNCNTITVLCELCSAGLPEQPQITTDLIIVFLFFFVYEKGINGK